MSLPSCDVGYNALIIHAYVVIMINKQLRLTPFDEHGYHI